MGFAWVVVKSQGKRTPQLQDKEHEQHILGPQTPRSVSDVKLGLDSQENRGWKAKRPIVLFNDRYQGLRHTGTDGESRKNSGKTMINHREVLHAWDYEWSSRRHQQQDHIHQMTSRRFRNRENFKKATIFDCGKFILPPRKISNCDVPKNRKLIRMYCL